MTPEMVICLTETHHGQLYALATNNPTSFFGDVEGGGTKFVYAVRIVENRTEPGEMTGYGIITLP